ncbi:MAG: hypothetical protein ACREPG_12195 [Candidatus Binatia bacterium]
MSLRSPLAFLVFALFAILSAPLWAQGLNISVMTSPSIELFRPHAGPVGLAVLVTGADGKPVENGWADIRLDAPKSGLFFSTDIPLVEGTTLVEMRVPLRRGNVEWQYDWPIRGEYRLAVVVISTDGKRASKTFEITVHESATKWLTLGGFAMGLFLFGFIAGRIFTVTKAGAASLVLALLLSGTALSSAVAQLSQPTAQAAQATLTVEPAVVGKPSRIVWRLNPGAGRTSAGATLSLAIKQLEENHTVFALEKLPVAGEFALNFQFVDGSEHSVTALAELPGRAPIWVEQRVSVTAVEPPATAALPAITSFLFVTALGLGAGRWSRLSAQSRARSKG